MLGWKIETKKKEDLDKKVEEKENSVNQVEEGVQNSSEQSGMGVNKEGKVKKGDITTRLPWRGIIKSPSMKKLIKKKSDGMGPYKVTKNDMPFINKLKPAAISIMHTGLVEGEVVFKATKEGEKGSVPTKPEASFANVTKEKSNEVLETKMTFNPPSVLESRETVAVIKPEKLVEARVAYGTYLYGYNIGQSVSIGLVRYHLFRMWKKFGLVDVSSNGSGIFFKIKIELGMMETINQGPWLINNIPLCIRKWEVGLKLERVEPSTIPIWVTIPNMPMELWNRESLSSMMSCVGDPIMLDRITALRCNEKEGRAGFARIWWK